MRIERPGQQEAAAKAKHGDGRPSDQKFAVDGHGCVSATAETVRTRTCSKCMVVSRV